MDTAHQWHQELGLVKPAMTMMMMNPSSTSAVATAVSNTCTAARPPAVTERRARPQKEQALNCPRCNSTNTKFCYYNNYSLTQPRYFCKTCRRYWTEGGSLRNVPVGGGSRKNKRSSSATAASSSSCSTITAAAATTAMASNPKKLATDHHHLIGKFHDGQDLNLAFPGLPEFNDFPNLDNSAAAAAVNDDSSNAVSALSAMELLRSGLTARGIGASFAPMPPPAPLPEYPTGFGLQEFRSPRLSFPLEGIAGGGGESSGDQYGTLQGMQASAVGGGGRLLFPFEDVKPGAEFDINSRSQNGHPPGFWNAMMSGGGRGSW